MNCGSWFRRCRTPRGTSCYAASSTASRSDSILPGWPIHFVDWANPTSSWFEMWTHVGAVAAMTSRMRLMTCVAQIPLRDPATLAHQAATVDHISNGRLELGLGVGLTADPSYEMMGIPNWSAKERVARFSEYVEAVDQLLSNDVSSYEGSYYVIKNAVMNPRPVQQPRPPITIAALRPVMLRNAARYADNWNSMSFADNFETQLEETPRSHRQGRRVL